MSRTATYLAPASANPLIPGELVCVDALASWIEDENEGDLAVSHVCIAGDSCAYGEFSLLELSGSRVEGSSFAGCDFSRAQFSDVVFAGCDFSNGDFSEANFTRCTFSSCKFTGASFSEAVFYRVEAADSTFSYASFSQSKLEDMASRTSDFSHADVTEARLKRVAFDDVRFTGTNFFRTSLSGVDLTTCQLADIVLSDQMGELRGCKMDLYQAAGIAQRLGVEIVE